MKSLSRVRLFATLWTVAPQAPLSMGFSKQGYWSGLPCPPPGNLCNPGIETRSPTLQVDSLLSEPPGKPLQCLCYAVLSRSVVSESLGPMDSSPPGSSVHGDSPGKSTGMGCHVLLQGIFPTQGSNPGLPHCRWILYYLSHQRSPRILEWVAYSFSS